METLEELKAIIDNAPIDGLATNFYIIYPGEFDIKNYVNMNNHTWWSDSMERWIDWGGASSQVMRSLSDIKRIIELMEIVEDAAALGFLTPSFDSGVSHKQLCKKYEAMNL